MKKLVLFIVLAVIATGAFAQINVNSSGDVGIGISSPSSKLYVFDDGLAEVRLRASSNNISRFWAINSLLAYGLGVDGSGYGHIYINVNGPTSLMTFHLNGNIGIGRTPSYKLDVNGNIRVNTTVYSSDRRLKTNIKMLDGQNEDLFKLEGVSYNFIQTETDAQNTVSSATDTTSNAEADRVHYGFIAQDVQKIFPDLVYEDDEGILGIDYVSLIPLIVKELKEQQTEIESLKEQLASIEENCCDNNLKSASLSSEAYSKSDGIEAQLSQNIPNPFNQTTKINCVIPSGSNNVNLYIYNMQGNQLLRYMITGNGEQSVTISAGSLKPGIYLYSLVIDGKEIDTKKMMLTE